MHEFEACPICHDDSAFLEDEGGFCVYVQCPNCGTHTSFISYNNEEEKAEAEERSVKLWNMGKVIAEGRGE